MAGGGWWAGGERRIGRVYHTRYLSSVNGVIPSLPLSLSLSLSFSSSSHSPFRLQLSSLNDLAPDRPKPDRKFSIAE